MTSCCLCLGTKKEQTDMLHTANQEQSAQNKGTNKVIEWKFTNVTIGRFMNKLFQIFLFHKMLRVCGMIYQ